MSWLDAAAIGTAFVLFFYLVYALFRPERF